MEKIINKTDVAIKILQGELLTFEEFVIALQNGYYDFPVNQAKEAYTILKASHYNSPDKVGYLCNKHVSRKLDNGKICGYGIHISELDPDFLTDDNKIYLTYKLLKKYRTILDTTKKR